jgi:plasmid stabilization system protein ParE
MRLIYHPEAESELIEAARFYENRVQSLGAEFLVAIDHATDQICKSPDQWRVVGAGVRRYLMQRFPYALYYLIQSDQIQILTVKHHSRHPDGWRDRIPK